MSTLFIQVFLSIFPCKFLTVAYTMIYNEYHKTSTGISWSLGISSQKKKEGKTSQEPQIQNRAGRETWSLTIKLLLKFEAILLLSTGAASWHISRQWWCWEQQQKQTTICSWRTQAYKMDTFPIRFILKRPKILG